MKGPYLILGGSGGVGVKLAEELKERGEAVHLCGRNQERLQEKAEALGGAGVSVCDVTDPSSLARAVEEASGDEGTLAGLAYCIGSILLKPLKRSTPEDFLEAFRVNTLGAALAAPLTQNEVMAKSIAQMHPVPRLGQAQDAAALAAFLLGPESSWITGQVVALDGGRSTLRIKG